MPDAREVPARARVTPADRRLRFVVLLGAVASLVAAHATLIGYRTFANVDEAYAAALQAAGVAAHHVRLPGHIHASFAFTRLLASARAYQHDAIAASAQASWRIFQKQSIRFPGWSRAVWAGNGLCCALMPAELQHPDH